MREEKREGGFSLLELMIATAVLVIGILTATLCILSLQDFNTLAREKEIAVADANRVLEAMRDAANDSLAALTGTNWGTWAAANVVNTKGTNELRLDQESVSVTLGGGNPVPITVELTWRHRNRPYLYRVVTGMTDRG